MRVTVLILLLAMSVFNGCTNSSGGGAGSSTGTTWTTEQISSANINCSTSMTKIDPTVQASDAVLMCGCVIENASKRWTYDDFVANEFSYTETMNREGVFTTCKERVLAQTTGTKWTTSQVVASRSNCTIAARESNSSISFAQAESACSCILQQAQTRWTYGDFVANETNYTAKLRDDGTITKCVGSVAGTNPSSALTKYAGSWRGPCTVTSAPGASPTSAQLTLRFDENNLTKEYRSYHSGDCVKLTSKLFHRFTVKEDGIAIGTEADKLNLTRRQSILSYFDPGYAVVAAIYALYGFTDWALGVEHDINNRSYEPNDPPKFLLDEMTFEIYKISGSRLYWGKTTSSLDGKTVSKRPDTLDYAYGFDYLWDLNSPPVFTTATAQTVILGQPVEMSASDPDGDVITLKCEGNCPDGLATPSYYSTWTPTQIGDFNQITLSASDGTKSTTKSFNVKVISTPNAPMGFSVTAGAYSVTLNWNTPSSNGSPITDYVIQFSQNNSATWSTYDDGVSVSTTTTIPNLLVGTAYKFRVAATNAAGTGAFTSDSSQTVPFGVPTVPLNLLGTAGNAQVVLTWSEPSSTGGSPITDYRIQYSSNSGNTWTTFSDSISADRTATVTGLANAVTYIFRVAAINAAGTGINSSNSPSVTPITVPGAPTSLSGTPGNEVIQLTWLAPSFNGGSAITDYAVQWSDNNGASWSDLVDGVTSVPGFTFGGFSNGTSYIFRVAAINAAGTGAYSASSASLTPRQSPSAPSQVNATSGNSKVDLIWSTPTNNGGSPITDYVVQYSTNGTSWTTFNDGVSTGTITSVTGLTNGTSYFFRVAAVNAAGTGGLRASTPQSLIPATTPGSPSNISGSIGNSQVSLTWTAPSVNGGVAVSDYIIQFSSNSGSSWSTYIDGTSTVTNTTVTGLVNGTSYLFRVAAVNSAGAGNYSLNSSILTPKGPPTPPWGLTGTAGNAQVQLTWLAPENNGGSPITDYILQRSADNGISWSTFNDGSSVNTNGTITGLSNGTAYIFRVAATNTLGTGDYSEPSTSLIPKTVPGAPTNLTGTAGVSQVTLNWIAPASTGGSDILDYEVEYNSSGGTWTTFSDGVSTNTGTTITGLSNGTQYSFRILAKNAAGNSNYSNTVLYTPQMTTPSAPRDVAATAGYMEVSISWNEPTSNGGGSITDYSIQYSSNSGTSWTTFDDGVSEIKSAIVTGLTNGTFYIFRVAAKNGIGTGPYSIASLPAMPSSRCVLGQASNDDCYVGAENLAINTERQGPNSVVMVLQYASGSSGFKIWKEKSGDRILNASGLISNGWQKKLIRSGSGFSESDFIAASEVGGRVCPPNVFLSHASGATMTSQSRCLYYDQGNATQRLDESGVNGIEASDWLQGWNRGNTGRGDLPSYYEGNIKTCGEKGMRLPVVYETTMLMPSSNTYLPNGDFVTPVWAGATGVPSIGWTWTASANRSGTELNYLRWSETQSSHLNYSGETAAVRCVLPSNSSIAEITESCSGSCYDGSQANALDSERQGPDGSIIHLKYANGVNGFKIWKEKNGSRILNATGLVSNGWQMKLARSGTSFQSGYFTDSTNIGGRVCPPNVFLSYQNMTATNRCLYYDTGNTAQTLNASCSTGYCDSPSDGPTEASDWLMTWDRQNTGRGALASFYEGNIRTCADKGMRLPVMYETTMPKPDAIYIPTGDGLSIEPTWAFTTNGVPAANFNWTKTASATLRDSAYPTSSYSMWVNAGSLASAFNSAHGIRCVVP